MKGMALIASMMVPLALAAETESALRGEPVFEQSARLTASDAGDLHLFGTDVDKLGSTALVGAQGAEAAYVFFYDEGGGQWIEEAVLTPSDGHEGDRFGTSVALGAGGDLAIVGAMEADVDSTAKQGAAYVFAREIRSGGRGAWVEVQKLSASGAPGDRFGTSVSASAQSYDVLLVGAPGRTVSGDSERGAAFLFGLAGNQYELITMIQASDGAAGDRFGFSTALSDDPLQINGYALVGAHSASVADDEERGAAYVFHRDPGSGLWNEDARLIDTDGQAGALFGSSLDISGDGSVAVIGAANGGSTGEGLVVIYEEDFAGWAQHGRYSGLDAMGAPNSVGIDSAGETVLAGGAEESVSGDGNRGAAAVLRAHPEHGWAAAAEVGIALIEAADGAAGDRFGAACALDGNRLVAAAPFVDDEGVNSGAVYLFRENLDLVFADRFE